MLTCTHKHVSFLCSILAEMQGTHGTTTWIKRTTKRRGRTGPPPGSNAPQNAGDARDHHLDEKQLKRMWMKQNLVQMQGTYGTTTWMKRSPKHSGRSGTPPG